MNTDAKTLPQVAVFAAPARCLIDVRVDRFRQRAGTDVEFHTIVAAAYSKNQELQLIEDLIEQLESASLFAPRRVVLVREGLRVLNSKRFKSALSALPARTHLWFTRLLGEREKLPASVLKSDMVVVQDPGPQGDRALNQWLSDFAKSKGSGIRAPALKSLKLAVGSGLDALVASLEKLTLLCQGREITACDVDELIGENLNQTFDRLVQLLIEGRRGPCLELVETMANQGLKMFDGRRIYGRERIAASVLPVLLSRLRRMVEIGEPSESLRKAIQTGLKLNPWYAKRLADEYQRLPDPRRLRLTAVALAAEVAQKRITAVSDAEILDQLVLEMTER